MRAFFASRKGRQFAWYLYDFGNSAYAAVVILAVYSVYFKEVVVGGAHGSALWGYSVAIAMAITAIIAPVLGAIADQLALKKRMLAVFTAVACAFTASFFFIQAGDILAGMILFICAEVGYRTAQVFYNALLPDVAERREFGRVSGNGWAIGSLGGIVCLAIVLPLLLAVGGNFVLRLSFVITALFFAVSTLPLFLFVAERPRSQVQTQPLISLGIGRIAATLRKARQYSEYLKFLVAFVFINDAVMIALNFAAIIGAVLYGFEREQLIVLIIIVQLANVAGAWLFGHMTDRLHAKAALYWSIAAMAIAVIWIQVNEEPTLFYVIGSVAGFAMAGLQAVSRTMVAKLVPASQVAEFYGVFALVGRSTSVIGPAIFGWLAAESAASYMRSGMGAQAAEQAGMHIAVYLILAFLAAGAVALSFVREESDEIGRRAEAAA